MGKMLIEIIAKKYIIDEHNEKVGVQIDIDTFNKVEEIIENYALAKLVEDDGDEESLNFEQAKEYYQCLEKEQ